MLFDLSKDISAQNDLSLQHLDRTKAMLKSLEEWDVSQPNPVFLEGAKYKSLQLKLYDAEYPKTQLNNPQSTKKQPSLTILFVPANAKRSAGVQKTLCDFFCKGPSDKQNENE